MSHSTSICSLILLFTLVAPVQAELSPDFQMETDPEFHALPFTKDFRRDFKGVWLQALQRPEADYQRMAAETVARAHEHGIPDLNQLVPALEKILTAPQSHSTARYAAARALIVLQSRDSAAILLEAGIQHGSDLRQLTEPALAEWDFTPARAVWTKRIQSPQTFPRDFILALRGLGRTREANVLPLVSKIAMDPLRPAHVRLEAAHAAGEISESGLEADADALAQDRRVNPLINRLCAVQLLTRHSSEQSRQLLFELARDPEPSLAVAALKRLNEIDPDLVLPLAEQAMQNADPLVRQEGANAYLHRPTPERVNRLTRLIDDDHPPLRQRVAESVYRLAEDPQLGEVIRAEAVQVLAGDRWQGQLQAILVLGMLDHKPAADRFVVLMESPRSDVRIHAAWGLRKLAEPRTIPVIVEKIRALTDERQTRSVPGLDEQVAHLFEACGKMQAKDAEPLMLQYVPRDSTRSKDVSRGAAIWALGQLHEGNLDESLADALIDRVQDSGLKPPESPLVKQMAVVALVRMRATKYASDLKSSLGLHSPALPLDLAARWGFHELTGEQLPPAVPRTYPDGVWFLEPLTPSTAN
ncbi:HEAT repeat domain-containing protein [Schlesneria paludicola]|uniref:HEAT repeat domain-containing protein n=1 Tax=Schlesneria paludicola TaxID=360056 RepID=UPI0002F2013E|nr:HEAT repeat domain-containing protein [Schlesneria paludicola]